MAEAQDLVLVLTGVATVIGIICSITVLITFRRSSKNNAENEGRWRQAQEDANKALETKFDTGLKAIDSKVDTVISDLGEVKRDLKKATSRMDRICAYHQVNHPGQPI